MVNTSDTLIKLYEGKPNDAESDNSKFSRYNTILDLLGNTVGHRISILDYGSGSGKFSSFIKEMVSSSINVTGFDLRYINDEQLGDLALDNKVNQIVYQKPNTQIDAKFDLVTSITVAQDFDTNEDLFNWLQDLKTLTNNDICICIRVNIGQKYMSYMDELFLPTLTDVLTAANLNGLKLNALKRVPELLDNYVIHFQKS